MGTVAAPAHAIDQEKRRKKAQSAPTRRNGRNITAVAIRQELERLSEEVLSKSCRLKTLAQLLYRMDSKEHVSPLELAMAMREQKCRNYHADIESDTRRQVALLQAEIEKRDACITRLQKEVRVLTERQQGEIAAKINLRSTSVQQLETDINITTASDYFSDEASFDQRCKVMDDDLMSVGFQSQHSSTDVPTTEEMTCLADSYSIKASSLKEETRPEVEISTNTNDVNNKTDFFVDANDARCSSSSVVVQKRGTPKIDQKENPPLFFL
eukprot:jgi/Bigna1/128228/aug1.6_g2936